MNSLRKPVLGLILLVLGAVLAGCQMTSPTDSSIPWSKPASWEGQQQGMQHEGH